MKKTILLLLAFVALGCTCREITLPGGVSYKSTRFGVKEDFADIAFTQQTNGAAALRVQGVKSDLVTGLGVVTEAAVSAAVKSAKP